MNEASLGTTILIWLLLRNGVQPQGCLAAACQVGSFFVEGMIYSRKKYEKYDEAFCFLNKYSYMIDM